MPAARRTLPLGTAVAARARRRARRRALGVLGREQLPPGGAGCVEVGPTALLAHLDSEAGNLVAPKLSVPLGDSAHLQRAAAGSRRHPRHACYSCVYT